MGGGTGGAVRGPCGDAAAVRSVSVLSLFSGIGLFDLGVLAALEEAGLSPHLAAQVEIDPFCRRVLAKHWPSAYREVTDVRDVERENAPWADLIIGGFPCTDVSAAGEQIGLSGPHSCLWWEYLRIVDVFRPNGVLVENVFSGLSLWHGTVRCSLEGLGYRTASARIDAADVGAPHGRPRVFVLAYPGRKRESQPETSVCEKRGRPVNGRETLADANGERLEGSLGIAKQTGRHASINGCETTRGVAKPSVGRDAHGRAAELDAHNWPLGQGEDQHEDEPPRTVIRAHNRKDRIKALGNGVTPQQGLAAMRWALGILGWAPEAESGA